MYPGTGLNFWYVYNDTFDRKLDFLVDFPPFFTREAIFVTSFLLSCIPSPLLNRGLLYEEKYFSFITVPFSEGSKNNSEMHIVVSPESVVIPLKYYQTAFKIIFFYFFP